MQSADNPQGRRRGNFAVPSETNTQSPFLRRKPRVRDVAYVAGLLDADGHIASTKKGGWHQVRIGITNRHRKTLEWIQDGFGGYIYEQPKRKEAHAQCYQWALATEDLVPFLKLLAPFLKIKQKQAYQAMALRVSLERRKKKETLDNLAERLKNLNRKGMIESNLLGD